MIASHGNPRHPSTSPAHSPPLNASRRADSPPSASCAAGHRPRLRSDYHFRHLPSYQELIDDPSRPAVYNSLPNNLTTNDQKALDAVKHVLRKPFASNLAQARQCSTSYRARQSPQSKAFITAPPAHPRRPVTVTPRERPSPPPPHQLLLQSQQVARQHRLQPGFRTNRKNKSTDRRIMDVGCYCVNVSRSSPPPSLHQSRTSTSTRTGVERHPPPHLDLSPAASSPPSTACISVHAKHASICGSEATSQFPGPWKPPATGRHLHDRPEGLLASIPPPMKTHHQIPHPRNENNHPRCDLATALESRRLRRHPLDGAHPPVTTEDNAGKSRVTMSFAKRPTRT